MAELEGFSPIVVRSEKTGRPVGPPSNRLRTRSWLSFLLKSLDDVERWALAWSDAVTARRSGTTLPAGSVHADIPEAWFTTRLADAEALAGLFRGARRPVISRDVLARPPSLLDKVLGPVLAGPSGGGRMFSDRWTRGVARPDETQLLRLDPLIPGSRYAFDHEPEGMDPWLYNALDFTNPWFAKLYLWRALDPNLNSPEWDESFTTTAPGEAIGTTGLRESILKKRDAPAKVSQTDVWAFEGMVRSAVLHAIEPDMHFTPELDRETEVLLDDAMAAPSSIAARRITVTVMGLQPKMRWRMLSNAVAAHRLMRMLHCEAGITDWWLRSVRVGMREDIDRMQRAYFGSAASTGKKAAAIDAALDGFLG